MTTTATATRAGNRYNEQVTTWADGFGIWHAKITFGHPGRETTSLTAHAQRLRRKAQRAIRNEVTSRGENGPGWVCRIEIADVQAANQVTTSITYREVVGD